MKKLLTSLLLIMFCVVTANAQYAENAVIQQSYSFSKYKITVPAKDRRVKPQKGTIDIVDVDGQQFVSVLRANKQFEGAFEVTSETCNEGYDYLEPQLNCITEINGQPIRVQVCFTYIIGKSNKVPQSITVEYLDPSTSEIIFSKTYLGLVRKK